MKSILKKVRKKTLITSFLNKYLTLYQIYVLDLVKKIKHFLADILGF